MRWKATLFFAYFIFLYAGAHVGNAYCKRQTVPNGTPQAINSPAHQSLESLYDVKFHHFDLNIEGYTSYINGHVRTVAKVLSPTLDSFAFELHANLIIDSVTQNGQLLVVKSNGGERIAVLASPLVQDSMIDVTIYYRGTPTSSSSSALGPGFVNSTSPYVTWSLSEPFAAYEWWPCKQALGDKIDSTWMFVTTDAANKVGSNGVLKSVVSVGNGKNRHEWKSSYPIDYYLISVAVAPYVEYNVYAHPEGYSDSILIQNYMYSYVDLNAMKSIVDQMASLMELYSKLFGLYPFAKEKYGHCMAPFGSTTEHQTMATIDNFNYSYIMHSMAHQWFGDNVTCATWKDIFVNESLTTYAESLAEEFLHGRVGINSVVSDFHPSILGLTGGSIWFTDSTNIGRIFDGDLTYYKGAAVIHMMRYEVNNDSVFFLALRNYQHQFGGSVAGIEDFKSVLENTSGMDFTQFYSQWMYGEGYPIFGAKWGQTTDSLRIVLSHRTSSSVTPLFVTPIDVQLKRVAMPDTIIRFQVNDTTEFYSIPVHGVVTTLVLDPDNWIINRANIVVRDTMLGAYTFVEDQHQRIGISPNPVKDVLSIDYPATDLSAEVYAVDGRLVAQYASINHNAIVVSDLVPGMYIVRVAQKGEAIGRRMFVKE